MKFFKTNMLFRDFLLIAISVSAAFVIENLRENLKENRDAQSLLIKISHEIQAATREQSFNIRWAQLHVDRIDSILTDLDDCKLEDAQKLVDMHVYVPYMIDVSALSSFDALKNSGLVSTVSNDTLVAALYTNISRNQRYHIEYLEKWKESQEKIKRLIGMEFMGQLELDKEFGVIKTRTSDYVLNQTTCDQLKYELMVWQSTMIIFSEILELNGQQLTAVTDLLLIE